MSSFIIMVVIRYPEITKNMSTPADLLWLRICIEWAMTTRVADIALRPSISPLYASVGDLFYSVASTSDIFASNYPFISVSAIIKIFIIYQTVAIIYTDFIRINCSIIRGKNIRNFIWKILNLLSQCKLGIIYPLFNITSIQIFSNIHDN